MPLYHLAKSAVAYNLIAIRTKSDPWATPGVEPADRWAVAGHRALIEGMLTDG